MRALVEKQLLKRSAVFLDAILIHYYTPLVKADRLAKRIGVRELYLKDDSVNHPTFSYKDRVVSVAATRAVELGFDTFGCASTGNLANSVSAHAARLGRLKAIGIDDAALTRIHGPVGLDIEAQTPAEIAMFCLSNAMDWLQIHECISRYDPSTRFTGGF
jgi:hypothetical protein